MWTIDDTYPGAFNICALTTYESVAATLETEIQTFNQPKCYIQNQVFSLEPKRHFMVESLRKAGMPAVNPEAGYFVIADFSTKGTFYIQL